MAFPKVLYFIKHPSANYLSELYTKTQADDPSLKGNQPQIINCQPIITEHSSILVPPLPGPEITDESREAAELEDHCNELSEWLAMVSLESPRVSVYDDVDPYLCRYSVPDLDNAKSTNLVSLKWHGLVPSRWIIELLVAILYVPHTLL